MATDPLRRVPDFDPILQLWVQLANQDISEFDLTVQVGGLIISGLAISAAAYHRAVGAQFASLYPAQANAWREPFDALAAVSDPASAPAHVHLREAFLFLPGAEKALPPQGNGILWRGRIAAVDAWWLSRHATGNYAPETP